MIEIRRLARNSRERVKIECDKDTKLSCKGGDAESIQTGSQSKSAQIAMRKNKKTGQGKDRFL
uniref:Uncharacterized protein n=1 Tax=Arundo donax TaxID=35708 RepID=A0A0A8XRD8_ARUDO